MTRSLALLDLAADVFKKKPRRSVSPNVDVFAPCELKPGKSRKNRK